MDNDVTLFQGSRLSLDPLSASSELGTGITENDVAKILSTYLIPRGTRPVSVCTSMGWGWEVDHNSTGLFSKFLLFIF